MATIVPLLTTFPGRAPGNGVCLFFYDAKNEYFNGGIGSAMGYSMYTGDMAYAATASGTMNGIPKAYLGIGFDVKGDFGTTNDRKPGSNVFNTTSTGISSCTYNTRAHNTITTRAGELSSYKVLSTTPNLSTYPLSGAPLETYGEPNLYYTESPPVTLHQTVTSRDDVTFTRVKAIIQNGGKRIRVEIKDPATNKYYPYQIIDLETGLGERQVPLQGITNLKVGLAFSTSESVMNCEIKNFSVYGTYSGVPKEVGYIRPHTTAKYTVTLSANGGCA